MRTSSSVGGDHVLGDILSWFLWKAGTKGVMGRGEKARTLRSFPSPPSRASHLSPALARSPLSLGKPVEETVTLLHEYIKYVPAHFYNITPGVFCHPSSDCLQKKILKSVIVEALKSDCMVKQLRVVGDESLISMVAVTYQSFSLQS